MENIIWKTRNRVVYLQYQNNKNMTQNIKQEVKQLAKKIIAIAESGEFKDLKETFRAIYDEAQRQVNDAIRINEEQIKSNKNK